MNTKELKQMIEFYQLLIVLRELKDHHRRQLGVDAGWLIMVFAVMVVIIGLIRLYTLT